MIKIMSLVKYTCEETESFFDVVKTGFVHETPETKKRLSDDTFAPMKKSKKMGRLMKRWEARGVARELFPDLKENSHNPKYWEAVAYAEQHK